MVTKPFIHDTICVPGRTRTCDGLLIVWLTARTVRHSGHRNILVCHSRLEDNTPNTFYLSMSVDSGVQPPRVPLAYSYFVLFETRVGFEPTRTFVNGFADRPFQPLRHLVVYGAANMVMRPPRYFWYQYVKEQKNPKFLRISGFLCISRFLSIYNIFKTRIRISSCKIWTSHTIAVTTYCRWNGRNPCRDCRRLYHGY